MKSLTTYALAAAWLLAATAVATNAAPAQSFVPVRGPNMHVAAEAIEGVAIPGTELARDAADLVRGAEGDLLYEHSTRVFLWAALAGRHRGLQASLCGVDVP